MKYNPEEYEPVEERIRRFYADHEDGCIITELLSSADNVDIAVVKAAVQINGQLRATGLAVEVRDKELQKSKKGYEYESVNYTSWLENAETSAVGRALANFNYAGSKRPSREEMDKVERMTRDPKKWGSKDERQQIIDEIAKIMKDPTFTDAQRDTVRNAILESDLVGLHDIRDTWQKELEVFF